jgi:hypothetical protein
MTLASLRPVTRGGARSYTCGRSLTYVAEQAGHSIATLARHYAGTMRELESEPRVPAAEAIRQAREQVCGTHSGRTHQILDDRK